MGLGSIIRSNRMFCRNN